jgi:hypothetical protein
MKNFQNHFSRTKFHSCRSNFTSKKKDRPTSLQPFKNSRNNNKICLIRRSRNNQGTWKLLWAFPKSHKRCFTFSNWIDKVDYGFCTSAPPTFVKCKTYWAIRCAGVVAAAVLTAIGKKNTSCLKGGYKLSCLFCCSPTTPHQNTHTHTQKSFLLCNSGLTPICICAYIYSTNFLIHEVIKLFLNKFVIFFFFFSVFPLNPSHLAAHNAKSSRNLFPILPLTACPISLLVVCVPK